MKSITRSKLSLSELKQGAMEKDHHQSKTAPRTAVVFSLKPCQFVFPLEHKGRENLFEYHDRMKQLLFREKDSERTRQISSAVEMRDVSAGVCAHQCVFLPETH